MLHIDSYEYDFANKKLLPDLTRFLEGEEAKRYYEIWKDIKGFPYFNGYTVQTPIHEDGDCERFNPASLYDQSDFE